MNNVLAILATLLYGALTLLSIFVAAVLFEDRLATALAIGALASAYFTQLFDYAGRPAGMTASYVAMILFAAAAVGLLILP